jgi:hypothetical protein
MEFDENNEVEEQGGEGVVEIYSRRAIFWFSLLASPLFGSVLLMLNLKAAGYKKAVNAVLAFIILFEVIANLVVINFIRIYKVDLLAYQKLILSNNRDPKAYDPNIFVLSMIVISFIIFGTLILTRYFFRKYFPDNDYYPKNILSALLVTILVKLFLVFIGIGQFII